MDGSRDSEREVNDDQLLRLSREGDRHAFSELWRRHAPVAVAYARSLGSAPPDPEDVVSDAFVRILHLLRTGKGPERSFRPYLLTTVRNTWMSAARRAAPTQPLDELEHPPSVIGAIDEEAMADRATIFRAFGSLPERWQHALWLSEVEQLPPRQIAEVLRMRPNSAAALTYRARDALRKAWIRAHLRNAQPGSDHARVIELLGAYAQEALPARSRKFVSAHLGSCGACRSAAREATSVSRAMTLGPLLAGGTGLVVAPALFPADQAAAALSALDVPSWMQVPAAAQPVVEAATHATPLLWPVAAATAVALSVSGGLITRPVLDPAASPSVAAATAPSVVAEQGATDAQPPDAGPGAPAAPETRGPSALPGTAAAEPMTDGTTTVTPRPARGKSDAHRHDEEAAVNPGAGSGRDRGSAAASGAATPGAATPAAANPGGAELGAAKSGAAKAGASQAAGAGPGGSGPGGPGPGGSGPGGAGAGGAEPGQDAAVPRPDALADGSAAAPPRSPVADDAQAMTARGGVAAVSTSRHAAAAEAAPSVSGIPASRSPGDGSPSDAQPSVHAADEHRGPRTADAVPSS